jgi:hypothetical protein
VGRLGKVLVFSRIALLLAFIPTEDLTTDEGITLQSGLGRAGGS